MLEHLRRRATPYAPPTPMRPPGCGGVGPSLSLALLDEAPDIAVIAPSKSCPHGASNATRWVSATC